MVVPQGAQMVVIFVQKQNPSSVSGRGVDLAHTLIKAKSPLANILYSELGKASPQAKFHLPGEIQTCNFLVCRRQPDGTEFSSSAAAKSRASPRRRRCALPCTCQQDVRSFWVDHG